MRGDVYEIISFEIEQAIQDRYGSGFRVKYLIWEFGNSLARNGSAGDHAVNHCCHVTARDVVGNEGSVSNHGGQNVGEIQTCQYIRKGYMAKIKSF